LVKQFFYLKKLRPLGHLLHNSMPINKFISN